MRRMHKDDAARLLTEAVELHGADRVSETYYGLSCFEFEPFGLVTDKPASLVGVVASLWGDQGLIDLLKSENVDAVWILGKRGKIQDFVTQGALELLMAVQSHEYQGHSWGEAVQAALQERG